MGCIYDECLYTFCVLLITRFSTQLLIPGLCSSYGLQLAEPCQRDGYQDPKNCHRCRCPDGFGGPYCETVAPSVKGLLNVHVICSLSHLMSSD